MTATTINTVPPPSAFHGLSLLALAAAPIVSVWANLFAGGTGDTWSHLTATVLPEYVANTLWLCLGVGVGVIVVGVAAAWLVTMHDFPGRRVFEWALVLPLAVPAYVMAYTYTDLLQFVGPVQSGLRESFGWQKGDYWFPDVRSLPGSAAATRWPASARSTGRSCTWTLRTRTSSPAGSTRSSSSPGPRSRPTRSRCGCSSSSSSTDRSRR